eukprot:CAMPEP_0117434846 /NCGR_PEP_ID=MMETSP0759-20121206/164_1 /TAXON_ID=63605 /ORGANISM="Percolomonas cosmopolitus, Strain WS" /LENGTH=807 /DNA_ID=CAMNT_0005226351 /DNA_START=301 /DNA_END=2721 /DNA_ORIENTATION=+
MLKNLGDDGSSSSVLPCRKCAQVRRSFATEHKQESHASNPQKRMKYQISWSDDSNSGQGSVSRSSSTGESSENGTYGSADAKGRRYYDAFFDADAQQQHYNAAEGSASQFSVASNDDTVSTNLGAQSSQQYYDFDSASSSHENSGALLKNYAFLDNILHKNPKKMLMHYRLMYLSGAEPLHLISYRKKVLNRLLESCLIQRNFKFGKYIFEKYFILDRSVHDEEQFQATDQVKELFFNRDRNLLGWGPWQCAECGQHNQSTDARCTGCNLMRDELLLGKDYILQQKLNVSLEELNHHTSKESSHTRLVAEEISEEDYFPDLPPVKPNYDTFHHYANLCARMGNSDELLHLLDVMGSYRWNPSLGVYVALLRLYVESGNYDAFYESYNQFFNDNGIAPDLAALRLLSRVLRAERNVQDFETLLQQMLMNTVSQQKSSSKLEYDNEQVIPLSRFDMKYKDVGLDIVVLNDMLATYAAVGNVDRIMELLDKHVIKSHQHDTTAFQVEPTVNTFNYALLALAELSDGATFDRIYKELLEWSKRKEQLRPNSLTYNALIKLYMGIGATNHIKTLVMPHFRSSPDDRHETRVVPLTETWQLLLEAFYAEVKMMAHIISWMRHFEIPASDRYDIILSAALRHLESKYGTKATSNDMIVKEILVDAFRSYNYAAVPLNESTLVVMSKLLQLASNRQIVSPGLAKYWAHVLYRACTRSFEGRSSLLQQTTIDALFELANFNEHDREAWHEQLSSETVQFNEFCHAVADGYLRQFEHNYFDKEDASAGRGNKTNRAEYEDREVDTERMVHKSTAEMK